MLNLDRDKCMTLEDFLSLSNYIKKFHSYSNGVGKKVKTIIPHIDTNTGYVYKLDLVMKRNTEEFSTLGKSNKTTLQENVTNWLEDN